jgi:hypothetical protein
MTVKLPGILFANVIVEMPQTLSLSLEILNQRQVCCLDTHSL